VDFILSEELEEADFRLGSSVLTSAEGTVWSVETLATPGSVLPPEVVPPVSALVELPHPQIPLEAPKANKVKMPRPTMILDFIVYSLLIRPFDPRKGHAKRTG